MLSIAIGKISVAFLIERIAGPSDWRKWLLRGISVSVFVSAVITFTLFYAQCQPARALWDQDMIKEGSGSCWNPISVNTWDLVIASKLNAVACQHSDANSRPCKATGRFWISLSLLSRPMLCGNCR